MFFYKVAGFIVFMTLAFIPSVFGMMMQDASVFTSMNALIMPPWTPPDEVFPIVWAILYFMIGLAGWVIWFYHHERYNVARAYVIYAAQLILNAAWSVAYWGLESPVLSFVVILVLLVMICVNFKVFYDLNNFAGMLLLPYLFWVAYATTINAGIIYYNCLLPTFIQSC